MAAIFGGMAMVALLGWILWTISAGNPLESPVNGTLVPPPDSPAQRTQDPLPLAPTRTEKPSRPRNIKKPPVLPTGPNGIRGLVLDAENGKPIPIFQVYILEAAEEAPLSRLEGNRGRSFHVRTGVFYAERDSGRWDVVVKAPGYEPSVLTGLPTPALEQAPVRFELKRGPGIVGLVLDETFMPVPDVKSFLHITKLSDSSAKMPLVRIATTGTDGRFSYAPLPDGEYAVTLLEPSNAVDRLSGLRVFGDTLHVEMYLRPRHKLTVWTQAENGTPLPDVQVELRSTQAHFAHGKSNQNGLVLLEHLPDGIYTLTATLQGAPPVQEELELIGGSSRQVRWLTLSP
jgi:hypothetical protein